MTERVERVGQRDEPVGGVVGESGASRVEVWRGGSVSSTGLRFHTPLIKPGVRFSRTRLSDKAVLIFCITRSPTNDCRYVR